MQNQAILDLQEENKTLRSDLDALKGEFYKNNFSSSQNFNKDCTFNSRLRVPVYDSAPAICEVGDLIAIAGKLYICTVANTTFTLVGTQT
ncbi:MAG: hypothetical protein V4469_04360 [Patescibacteria group bacterium]